MTRKKGTSGLNALFDKVFDGDAVKNALTTLHDEFGAAPDVKLSPSKLSVVKPSDEIKDETQLSNNLPLDNEPSNIPPSAIQPSNCQLSNRSTVEYPTVSPSAIPPSDKQLSNRQIFDGNISDPQTIPQDIISMSYNQAAVFDYLIKNDGVTNMRAISGATSIGIPSVKDAMSRLVRRGFMHNPVTIRSANFQGFSYILNQSAVGHFKAIGGLEQRNLLPLSHRRISDRQTDKKTDIKPLSIRPSDSQPLNGGIAHSSSSFKIITTTTTEDPLTVGYEDKSPKTAEGFVLVGPIEAYWGEEGLQEAQAQKWCSQFEVEPDQMRQQLEWARFDLEVNDRRSEVKKDVISWFFGHLRKTGGCFPRPGNYKSPTELRAEALEIELAKETEAKERLTAAEMERDFRQILSDPEGERYKALLMQINEFARTMEGEALESCLREEFFKNSKNIE